ncbi:MAG: hypothetical protein MUC88_17725 [Planctomycetes bacterium]|nr:hypothetical protein [Planctomycetota bacterium]
MCGRRLTYRRAAVILGFCLVAVTLGAPSAPTIGDEKAPAWKRLNLSPTSIGGMNVYCEKALEPNLPVVEREVAKLAADRGKLADILARRREIIADIQRIVGVTEGDSGEREKTFQQMAGLFARTKLIFYLARTTTIKDFLRQGGQLPDFRYDRTSDMVTYSPRLHGQAGEQPPEAWDLWIPIAPGKAFEQQIGILDQFAQRLGSGMAGVAIHEITEMTLLQRARPTDPYWRWFSDGFANAITCTLLEKHVGQEAAQGLVQGYDPDKYKDLAQEINLRYWMLGNYGLYVSQVPVQTEARILYARYTYALLEARRLIERHGLDCVRAILDRIAARDQRGGRDLLQAIQEATGEDLEPRLLQYQDFATAEEGGSKYAAASKAAAERKDEESLFVNLMRSLELRGGVLSQQYLQDFLNGAMLLFWLGHEDAADEAMHNCLKLFSRDSIPQGREAALEAFVRYALNSRRPRKADKMADELLVKAPEHVPALVVKMLTSTEDGNRAQARDYARRVQRLSPATSASYRAAAQILAVDPNGPSEYKEPAGPK